MSASRQIFTLDDFCRVLTASGLLAGQSLSRILADFHADADDRAKRQAPLTAFTSYLVAAGILTCWQIAKLRSGQYKGFFLDGYRIEDHLGEDVSHSRYLAQDMNLRRYAVLCIRPPAIAPLKDGNPEYWVEEFPA
jgi:hypothetical protein